MSSSMLVVESLSPYTWLAMIYMSTGYGGISEESVLAALAQCHFEDLLFAIEVCIIQGKNVSR